MWERATVKAQARCCGSANAAATTPMLKENALNHKYNMHKFSSGEHAGY
jgi:hypothetical protein